MSENLPETRRRAVLAVFAHPDDDELACFGTLARFQRNGCDVTVLELTAGEATLAPQRNVRSSESRSAADLIGYSIVLESLPDGYLSYDARTVSLIERYCAHLLPSIVITHYPQSQGRGHQDHEIVAHAVVNAARRSSCVDWILYAEPPTQGADFVPNLYVNISDYIELKKQAIQLHQSEGRKPYMNVDMVVTKGRWWAMQVHPEEYNTGQLYEAFVIVKGTWRPRHADAHAGFADVF